MKLDTCLIHYFYSVSLYTLAINSCLLFESNPLSFYNGFLLVSIFDPHSLECDIWIEPWDCLVHPYQLTERIPSSQRNEVFSWKTLASVRTYQRRVRWVVWQAHCTHVAFFFYSFPKSVIEV